MVGEKMWENGSKIGQIGYLIKSEIITLFTKIFEIWQSLWLYRDVNVPVVVSNAE